MVWYGLNSEDYDRKYTDKELIRRIFPYFKPFRKKLIIVAVSLLCSAILGSLVPFIGNLMTVYGANRVLLISLFVGLALVTGFTYLLNYIQWSKSSSIIGNLILSLQTDAHKAVINQDMSFFDKYPVGKLLSRINSDTSSFADMAMILIESMSSLLVVVIIFIPMFIIDWIQGIALENPYRSELLELDWRSPAEFMGYLVRILENEVNEDEATKAWESATEKSWIYYTLGLSSMKQNKLKSAEQFFKASILAADPNAWEFFLALSKL